MTEKQRIERIAELLVKAFMLSRADEVVARYGHESDQEAQKAAREPTDEERIIIYLQCGSASPKELSAFLGFSRRTLNRITSKLISDGVIVRKGRTKRTEYELGYRLKADYVLPRRYSVHSTLDSDPTPSHLQISG